MGSNSSAPDIHRDVSYFTETHFDPIHIWNAINSFHSIITYINTTVSLFPICLLIHHSCIFIRYPRSLTIQIKNGAQLTVTMLAGITMASLIMCSAILFPVAAVISTKNSFTVYLSFNLKILEREQLYEV
jgi:hypothetical protein